jgi:DNA-binding transcriptional regulator YiaG
MPNIAKVLKDEIARISRKEARAAVAPVRKPSIRLRKDVADLKTRIAALEKANQQLQGRLKAVESATPTPPPSESAKGWITGNGINNLRRKMGVSQAELASLVGVSPNAVYIWETKPGMLKLRSATKAAVFAIRGIGAREARKRLEAIKAKTVKAKKTAKKVSKRGKRK